MNIERTAQFTLQIDFAAGGTSPFTQHEEDELTAKALQIAGRIHSEEGDAMTEGDYDRYQVEIEDMIFEAAGQCSDWEGATAHLTFAGIDGKRWATDEG